RTIYSFLKSPYTAGTIDLDNLSEFNHVKQESIDSANGSYSINETWILASGNYKDDRTVSHTYQINELNELIKTTSINGTIQGYGDTTLERYNNANAAFVNVVGPEINYENPTGAISKNDTHNRFAGTVTYSI